MRILVLAPWYYPFVHPRAYRWTHITRFWATQGHEVHVVCARQRGFAHTSPCEGVRVHRTGFDSLKEVFFFLAHSSKGRGRLGAGKAPPGKGLRLLSSLYRNLWKRLCFPDDAWQWYAPAFQKAVALHKAHSFDVLISVSLPFTTHLVGCSFKRRYPQVRWLVDVGDPYSLRPGPLQNPIYFPVGRWLERRVLSKADKVVVTNPALAEHYCRQMNLPPKHIAVVPPLWNEFPAEGMAKPSTTQPGWHVGYFGTFYAPIRTPKGVVHLIRQTFQCRPDLRDKLFFHFYGEIFPEFWHELYRLPNTYLHGLCAPEAVQKHMRHMRLLLSVGNTTSWQLPSKAVSYLASGRPVVHLSHIKCDALVRFWGEHPHLLVLELEDGRIGEADFGRWLSFLENPPPEPSERERRQRIAPYRTECIGEAYLQLLQG